MALVSLHVTSVLRFLLLWTMTMKLTLAFVVECHTSSLFLRRGRTLLFDRRRLHLFSSSNWEQQQRRPFRDVEIPLLDSSGNSEDHAMIQPLPSFHLPEELATLHMYGMEIDRPVHRLVIDHALEQQPDRMMVGYVAFKPRDDDTLVGAIGCTAQVMLTQQRPIVTMPADQEQKKREQEEQTAAAMFRGGFRFVVKEVIKTIPYSVVIVDELLDDEPGSSSGKRSLQEHDDDNDDEDDDEDDLKTSSMKNLNTPQLVSRLLQAMHEYADHQLEEANARAAESRSPLERAILDDIMGNKNNLPQQQQVSSSSSTDVDDDDSIMFSVDSDPIAAQQYAAEEMVAVLDVFHSSLIDLFPLPKDRFFAMAFLAAELINSDNSVRRKCLTMTDGLERLRYVLAELEDKLGMSKARKLALEITDRTDEQQKDLKVGEPSLPPWAKQIRKGMQVEYYWNEEYGWCLGEVVQDPVLIVNELIVTLYFPSDGSTHRLPFTAEEKVRWRPPQPPTSSSSSSSSSPPNPTSWL